MDKIVAVDHPNGLQIAKLIALNENTTLYHFSSVDESMSKTISDLVFRPTSMAGRPCNGHTTVAPNYELLRSSVVVDVV